VPFLLELPKDTVVIRQRSELRGTHHFAGEEPNSWGNDITGDQTFMLLLAGIKTLLS
jgi:hypothetical protein